ncbi:major facilitator superfamily domain-containing protein [Mycena leptocephala]|nr:major facilitator superfamily domain-containing protein [Mycena leptocephala]
MNVSQLEAQTPCSSFTLHGDRSSAIVSPEAAYDGEEIYWDSDDPANPQNWPDRRKWHITLTCIVMTVNVTFASSAPSSATLSIVEAFNVSGEVSYLITSTFLLGYVFGALAQNIETLLITRFLGGFFAVAPLVNAGGVIADIWAVEKRGIASSMFAASVFLGPVMGPIVAGYIVESSLSWRWVFWVMMIFTGTCTFIMVLTLPETYAPVLLLKKVKAKRQADPVGAQYLFATHEKQDWSLRGIVKRTLFRPFQMLAGEPILVLVTVYLSLVYGVMYCLFEAFPIIFIEKRGFTIAQNGLIFIGVGIGTTLGALLDMRNSRRYPQLMKTWRGFPPPEERLLGGMVGGCAFAVGIFWLGWSGQYPSVPWYVPALSTIFVGMSISLIFISFLSYLVDTYLAHAASAFAANTFCRSLVAAAFPLFTVQMFSRLGVNWACTLLGGVGLLLAPSPFLFYKYGVRIRANSEIAPCMDLKIAQILAEEKMFADGEKMAV